MKVFKNGFSLVELIVSLTVILLLTGIGVTTFSGLLKAKKVSTVKNELLSWVSLSKNLALTGQLPDGDLGLKFVKITFTSSNFLTDGIDDENSSYNFFTKNFKNDLDIDNVNITVTNNGNGISSFGFNKGTGRLLDVGGTMIDGPVRILVESNGVTDSITINDLGVINEK